MLEIAMGLARAVQATLPRGDLAAPTTRAAFLDRIDKGSCLEIGPFDSPVVAGPGVRYFDVLDSKQLAERSRVHGRDTEVGMIPQIDYVSPTGDLAVVDRAFRSVVSSHFIEHQPDLIGHLVAVAQLLEPGGSYFVICPDKRYCFDYFNTLSTRADVERAHTEQRQLHDCEMIRAHIENTTHNSGIRHWLGFHGRPVVHDHPEVSTAADRACEAVDRGEYVDVHAWIFSDESFREIVTGLCKDDRVPFDLVSVTRTHFGRLEFFAELRRKR